MHTVYYSPNGGEIQHISDARDIEWERYHHFLQGFPHLWKEFADDELPADRASTLAAYVVQNGALVSRLRLGGTAAAGIDVSAVVSAAVAEALKKQAAVNQELIKRAVIEALAAERTKNKGAA